MILKNRVSRNSYADSVFLMSLANQALELPGVLEASALMGTPENKELLRNAGLLNSEGETARPDDLIIALKAENQKRLEEANEQVLQLMAKRLMATPAGDEKPPRTIGAALDRMPDATLVLISLPGKYVAWEAEKVLEAGRHLMIFSDNVSVEQEVALKAQAARQQLLVMGPDCGTAILGGKALGFGNAVRSGAVGIVAASGTGIQEACSLLDRFDEGISHAIGLGGRDLSVQVHGSAALQAIGILEADAATEAILFISKPPDAEVAAAIMGRLAAVEKPCVVCLQGMKESPVLPDGLTLAASLEDAVRRVMQVRGREEDVRSFLADLIETANPMIRRETARLGPGQRYVRGLFSGGSLCAEAGIMLRYSLPGLSTNIGLPDMPRMEKATTSRGHALIDLGADEFTVGVPHPMIDFTVRSRRIIQEAEDPKTAVILFDLVLGYGAHPDPAGAILPALLEGRRIAAEKGRHLCCVASICGTRGDSQDLERQVQMLSEHDVLVFPSTSLAARTAAHIALRSQEEMVIPAAVESRSAAGPSRGPGAAALEDSLVNAPLKVINMGLPSFAESLRQQDVPVLHVDWRPPAGGDKKLLEVLRKLR
jgi:FdrA protein